MAIDPRSRKRERFWLGLTVRWVILSALLISLSLAAGELAAWRIGLALFWTLNALLWWLYLRHKRRKREAAAQGSEADQVA